MDGNEIIGFTNGDLIVLREDEGYNTKQNRKWKKEQEKITPLNIFANVLVEMCGPFINLCYNLLVVHLVVPNAQEKGTKNF